MSEALNVFIVTEGGGRLGYGHLARCQSLCHAFSEYSVEPTLLVDGDESALEFCHDQIAHFLQWHSDEKVLWNYIKHADMVIIDSLLAPETLFTKLQDEIRIPVFLDDHFRRDYFRGVVVDWTVLSERKFYQSRNPSVTYLLGSCYAALRKPFWDTPVKPISASIDNILITFGGSDVANMTPQVLPLVDKLFPMANIQLIIGLGYLNVHEITKMMRPNYNVFYCPDAVQMKDLMFQADLAIATGGQTLYELARMGVPTVATMVVDSQIDDIKGWADTGFLFYSGSSDAPDIINKIISELNKLKERKARLDSSLCARQYIDGGGAKRLISALRQRNI